MCERIRPLGLVFLWMLIANVGFAATTAGDVGSIKLSNLYVDSASIQPGAQTAEVVLSQFDGPWSLPRPPRASRETYPIKLDLKDTGDQAIYAMTLNANAGLEMTIENGKVVELKTGYYDGGFPVYKNGR